MSSSRPANGRGADSHQDGSPAIFLMCDSLQTGGIERQFNMLARAMREHGYRVFLGCMRRQGAFLQGLEDIVEYPSGGSFLSWTSFHSRVRLLRFFLACRIQVAQSFDFYSNLMMVPSAKLAGVPAVVACQNQLGDLLTPMQNRVEIGNFRRCDRVVCNSQAAADRLARLGVPGYRLVVIRNGIENPEHVPGPALPPEPTRVRIGLVARMNHPVKNHDGFLRAAAKIAARHANVDFLLAGDGPLRPTLERQAAELGIADRVKFLGDRGDVPAVLAALDISVVPSKSESLANVMLESMAAGKAVIAANVGGLGEVIENGKTGLLVPAGDDEKLAFSMELFISRPDLREQYGREARNVIIANFSLMRLRDEHLQLYDELLCRRG